MEAGATKKEGKAQGGDNDPSMEEILQSIRSIIAEDGEETKGTVNAEAAKDKAPAANGEAVAGSDVLELTEMVKEEAPAAAQAAPAAAAAPATDILSSIDAALAVTQPAAAIASPASSAETLLSDQAAQAASQSIKKLKVEEPLPPLVTTPSLGVGSGNTVESLVIQMLKPMIKEWLDGNLPKIVERIVEREVRKITRQ